MSQLFSLLLCCCYSQFVTSQMIIQPPQNQTDCEGGTVNFTCVVMFTSGPLEPANWFTNNGINDASRLPDHTRTDDSNGRSAPANVTTVLTVIDINITNNGADYICAQGLIERSDPVFLTVIDLPLIAPTLTDRMPSIASSTSFIISWTINNTNYDIIVILTNLRTEEVYIISVTEYTLNTNTYNVTEGLNGMDNYNVSVATNNTCGMMMSDTVTVYDKPKAPINVRIRDDITGVSFVVLWDEVMDPFPVDYTVRWYGDGIDNRTTVSEEMVIITGLTPNTNYSVTVFANNLCCGAGPVSDVIMTMTNDMEGTTPPPPPPSSTPIITPTVTSGPSDGDDRSSVGPIVGGVVGGIIAVILVVIIIVVVYLFCYRKKDSTDSDRQGLKSPTVTGGSHTASIKPASNVPHQTAASGEEYAVTTRPTTTTTTTKPQQPAEEYAVVDKSKKHAAATQGIHYADLQELPGAGSKPPTNQGPTSTYAMVA